MAAPTGKAPNLREAVHTFGCPDSSMNEVRRLAYELIEQGSHGTVCKRSQYFTHVKTPSECSTVDAIQCSTHSVCRSTCEGTSPGLQSSSSSRVPSQDFSEDMTCGISSCPEDYDVRSVGCGLSSQRYTQNGSRQAVNQQSQKPDASPESSGTITTLVVQNIPLNYTTSMLIQELNSQGFQGVYDFLYHPLDHQTRNARPFAFLNFATPLVATAFYLRFHGKLLKCSRTGELPLMVLAARVQGVAANTERYFTCKSEVRRRFRARPINLHIDNRRVKEVDAHARQLLMEAQIVCAPDSRQYGCTRH